VFKYTILRGSIIAAGEHFFSVEECADAVAAVSNERHALAFNTLAICDVKVKRTLVRMRGSKKKLGTRFPLHLSFSLLFS